MGGRWELHRRVIGGTRKEDTMLFLGKMKKMSFSLEKKEKVCIFASRRNKIVNNMKAAISQEMKTVSIELPVSEYNFLKTLSKKNGMGY
jgi:hypothetical protein